MGYSTSSGRATFRFDDFALSPVDCGAGAAAAQTQGPQWGKAEVFSGELPPKPEIAKQPTAKQGGRALPSHLKWFHCLMGAFNGGPPVTDRRCMSPLALSLSLPLDQGQESKLVDRRQEQQGVGAIQRRLLTQRDRR